MQEYYSVLEVVQRCAGRITWTARGLPLSSDDQSTLEFALVCWGCLLRDILPHDQGIRQYCAFFQTKTCDTAALVRTLKSYKELLLSITVVDGPRGTEMVSRFKHERAGETLYHGLITPVRSLFLHYAETKDVDTFKSLFQWLSFLEHVNLRSLDLTVEGEAAYCSFEEGIGTWSYPPEHLRLMGAILSRWLDDFHFDGFHPGFGPGAIAGEKGRLGTRIKLQCMGSDQLLTYFTRRLPDSSFWVDPLSRPLSRCNDIVFVPKSMDKNRIISKEPAALGYFQHGIQYALYKYTYSHRDLKARIDFRDQARSRDLARFGSLYGEYATLDLSNASDSVTTALIKAVVKNPELRRGLIATRSHFARLPSGKVIRLGKFAPMGSAVCFPIETLIFASICEMAAWMEWGRASQVDDYVVYGDDIVVRTALVPTILQLLDAFHFQVNTTKSYWYVGQVPIFREACGGFYLNGYDVTPVRLSRRLTISRQAACNAIPSTREALVDLANAAYLHGFRTLRFGVLSYLKQAYPGFSGIAFCDLDYQGSDRLLTDYGCDSNWNLKRRPSHVDSVSSELKCLITQTQVDSALASHYMHAYDDDNRVYEAWQCDRAALTYERRNLGNIFHSHWGVEEAPERAQLDPCRSRERWKWVSRK